MKDERSLVNLCYDLIELDADAAENKEFIEQTLKAFGDKVESYVRVDQVIDRHVEQLQFDLEEVERKIKALKNFKKACRDRAAFVMQALGTDKIMGPNGYSMRVGSNESVEVTDINLLPDWAKEKKVTVTPKKLAIKDAIRSGQRIEGAVLQKNVTVSYRCTAKDLINSTLRGLTDSDQNSSTPSTKYLSSEKEPGK